MKKSLFFTIAVLFVMFLLTVGAYLYLIKGENKKIIRDSFNDRQLVEYYHFDLNILRLSIVSDGNDRWIKHPKCCLTYSHHILDNEIVFDRANIGFLLVNGKSFKIEYLDEQ